MNQYILSIEMSKTNYKIIKFKDDYIKIDLEKLKSGVVLPFDIYVKDLNIIKYLYNKGTIFPENAGDYLKKRGIRDIFILSKDLETYEDYLRNGYLNDSNLNKINLVSEKDYRYFKVQFHQINSSVFIPGTEIYFNLYLFEKTRIKILVKASKTEPYKIQEEALINTGEILINKNDLIYYQEYLDSVSNIQSDDSIKARIVKETSKIVVRELFDNPRSGEILTKTFDSVNKIINCIIYNNETLYDLLNIKNHDYYTYTHSVNVSVLAIGLGIAMGLKKHEIDTLGFGAILHDIGKSLIPSEILNKRERLSDEEYMIMQTHVNKGEDILNCHRNIPEEAFIPVSQHHEKLSGKGYPRGLNGDKISLTGRITAIVDCYDALTTQRPYRKALTPFEALKIIEKESENYDYNILKNFILMLGNVKNYVCLK